MSWGRRVLSHVYFGFLKISQYFENIPRNQILGWKISRYWDFWILEISRQHFSLPGFLCLWPYFGVSRLLIWFSAFFPLTSFRPKIDEHDLRSPSITRDLIWPRTLFQGMREIDVRRGTERARQKSRPFLGYLRKTTGGGALPPPIGSRVDKYHGLLEAGMRWPKCLLTSVI